jgi:hypothetical protein
MFATKRFIKVVALALTMVTATMATADSAAAATAGRVRPLHYISCAIEAIAPQQYYRGTIVTSSGHFMCTSPPDVVNTSVIIWRYDGNGKYSKLVNKASNQSGTDWWVVAQKGCDYSRAFPMHTQVLFDAFHGNWWEDSANSETVTMYC